MILWDNECVNIATVELDYEGQATLKEGTPIDADGKVANDGTAIGLLTRNCNAPWDGTGDLYIAGFIDLDKAEEASGVTLSDAAKKAMRTLVFISDGTIQPIPEKAPGEAVADATSETVVTQVNALIASLVEAGVIEEYEEPSDPEE